MMAPSGAWGLFGRQRAQVVDVAQVWAVFELKSTLYSVLDQRGLYADAFSDCQPHVLIPQTREAGDPVGSEGVSVAYFLES